MIPPLLSETNTSDDNHNAYNFPTKFPTLPSFETHQYSSSSISNNITYPFDFVTSCKPFNTQIITNNVRSFSHLPILAEPPPLAPPPPPNSTDQEKCRVDLSSILLNMSSSVLGDFGIMKPNDTLDNLHTQQQFINNYPQTFSHDQMQAAAGDQFVGAIRSNNVGSYPLSISDLGKPSFIWDSSSSCPSEVSTSLSTTNCYT